MKVRAETYPGPDIIMIPLRKIKTLFEPHVTEVFYKRMKNNLYFLDYFDLILPVEKYPHKDEYVLVGRYDVYSFIANKDPLKSVPCIVETFTGREGQYLKILRRLQNKGDSNSTSKERVLSKPQIRNLSLPRIENMTGLTKKELSGYKYNQEVPKKYINLNTTVNTLNWISSLIVNDDVKAFLYKRAGLPQGNNKRLTDEKRKLLQVFFKKVKRFEQLSSSAQIKVLRDTLKFKDEFIHYMQIRIDSLLN
ncbi:hypothetical protein AB1K89_12010 [Sporosarcina sp. 179-K 8C2 HS]|uniref:hypothetical protein n=1 Tax=Sporosarcina sp. 179-K 8C2 HS TaxID=3142387 RepID=UPI00399F7836